MGPFGGDAGLGCLSRPGWFAILGGAVHAHPSPPQRSVEQGLVARASGAPDGDQHDEAAKDSESEGGVPTHRTAI